jgi:NADH-quinone oxidoreductase subunit C
MCSDARKIQVNPSAETQQNTTTDAIPAAANRTVAAAVALVRERYADGVIDVVEHRGETTLVLRPEVLVEVAGLLRDAPGLRFRVLADLTAVDWLNRDPRYDVVYHLLSLEAPAALRLKVRAGDEDTPSPEVPSVTSIWPGANWYEREVFDLFGIRFTGHPNLTRIEMPADWVGHPLRKDYPLTGIQLPEPHWGGQIPFDQPLPLTVGEETLRLPNRAGDVSSGPVLLDKPEDEP